MFCLKLFARNHLSSWSVIYLSKIVSHSFQVRYEGGDFNESASQKRKKGILEIIFGKQRKNWEEKVCRKWLGIPTATTGNKLRIRNLTGEARTTGPDMAAILSLPLLPPSFFFLPPSCNQAAITWKIRGVSQINFPKKAAHFLKVWNVENDCHKKAVVTFNFHCHFRHPV